MRLFLTFLVLPLLAVYAMNASLDAGGLETSSTIEDLSRAQGPSDLLVSPTQFDQRAWVRARLTRPDGCPEVLILGSSTVGELDSEMFPGHTLVNGFLAGPMVEDFEAVTAVLRRTHCKPKAIVVGVDPWWLGNPAIDDRRWMGLLDDYLAFKPDRSAASSTALRAQVGWARFEERLNFTTSRESAKLLLANARGQRGTLPHLEPTTADAYCAKVGQLETYMRAPDGHYASCIRPTNAERHEIAEGYLKVNMHSMGEWRELATDRIQRFAALVREWKADADQIILLGTPYNPITFANLTADPKIARHLRDLDGELEAMTSPTVWFANFRDASAAGCEESSFEDSHHAARDCVATYSKALAARVPH